ncbi:MAG: glycerophosphodiester phosphodiesterase family protein [Clostridia bacterium]|nr:glycerophosphodiester phosphodiesterase family protein [Clostridia bacterium]
MRIIAHRAGPNKYPEQTIQSARHAIESGADMAEMDVRYTKDKKLACMHDPNAYRVFGVDKLISDMTEEEFRALRHKNNPDFCSHTFEDYLKCGVYPLLIHVKDCEVLDDLLAILQKYDYLDKVTFGVPKIEGVRKIKSFDKNLKVLAFMPTVDDIEEFAHAGVDYIRLWETWMSEENVKRVKNTGKELWIMVGRDVVGHDEWVGVTTKEGIKKMKEYEVDGILINDIEFLKSEL